MPDTPEAAPNAETAAPESAKAPPPAREKAKQHYFWGTGRRKTSIARVRIRPGDGKFQVNGQELKQYFPIERLQHRAQAPLAAANMANKLDVFVNARGGGLVGQADAVIMGLARALVSLDRTLGPTLRERGCLTRDAREVERKKYGRAGARRRFQFSKR